MKDEEGNGLRAEYFNGPNFEEKVLTRIDEEINFYYKRESPAPGVPAEYYSIRWTGQLYAPVTGKYRVFVTVDDGVRMWVNGHKVLDSWKLQEASSYAGYLNLEGGTFYSLKIEYFNKPNIAVMKLMWESPEDYTSFFGFFERPTRKVIPKKYLFGNLPEEKAKNEETEAKKEIPAPEVLRKREDSPGEDGKSPPVEKKAVENVPEINPVPAVEELYENLKSGSVVQFKNVLFEQGKYILLEGAHPELDKLVRTMKKYPEIKIRIEGHTDNVGDPNLNKSLSFFRAKVVEAHLLQNGIEDGRIEVKGYGSSRPLAGNSTEEGRAKNRRVEFVVL